MSKRTEMQDVSAHISICERRPLVSLREAPAPVRMPGLLFVARAGPISAGHDPAMQIRRLRYLQARSLVASPGCVSPHHRGRRLYADDAVMRDLAGPVAATAPARTHSLKFHFESAVTVEVP